MAKIDISKLSDTELLELLEKARSEETTRLQKNLQPMKDDVATKFAELQKTVVAILKIDKDYTAPFTVKGLERTTENLVAHLTANPNMGKTDLIRSFSGSSKVVGEWIAEQVKGKTIVETKGKNAKNQETFSYALPSK